MPKLRAALQQCRLVGTNCYHVPRLRYAYLHLSLAMVILASASPVSGQTLHAGSSETDTLKPSQLMKEHADAKRSVVVKGSSRTKVKIILQIGV